MTGQFILGLGAQKAGSTWAHSYFEADPVADLGPIKEYHVWDALHLPEMAHFDHRGRGALRNGSEALLRRALNRAPSVAEIRGRLQDDLEGYFDFFAARLSQPGITLTGDITPAYAGLPVSVLETIRDGMARRGIPVRALFLMRDPVARCISSAQMNRRKRSREEAVPLDGGLDAAVLAYAHTPQAQLRADYTRTVQALGQVFAPEDTFFGFYETLFQPSEIARLSQFAGVSCRPDMARQKINAHTKTEGVSETTSRQLRAILAPTYDFCAQMFPETQALWQPNVAPQVAS